MTSLIPICFYPTKKIILDDDHEFALSILLKMHNDHFVAHHSPTKTLNYLLHEYKPLLNKADLIYLDDGLSSKTQQTFSIDISKFNQILMQSTPEDISVLLIDYHMPEMNGIDFLKKIQHLPLKKILVTGESDYKIAINAFNNGLVDAYIRKDEPDFATKIQDLVCELEWKYFRELSNLLMSIDTPNLHHLKNIHLPSIFKNFINEHGITAFCLINMHGDFVTIDKNGKRQYFLIRDILQLHELAVVAKADNGSSNTIHKLENMEAIPFFNEDEFWQVPASEWDKYLYPVNKIIDEPTLVWSVVITD